MALAIIDRFEPLNALGGEIVVSLQCLCERGNKKGTILGVPFVPDCPRSHRSTVILRSSIEDLERFS